MILRMHVQILSLVLFFSFFRADAMEEKREIIIPDTYIANANNGHIEEIEYIIGAYLKFGGYLDNERNLIEPPQHNEHFKVAAAWFARLYIRIHQDATCYKRPTVMDARVAEYLQTKPFTQAILDRISQKGFDKICLEQLPWAEQILEQRTMAVPAIGGYVEHPRYPEYVEGRCHEGGYPIFLGWAYDIIPLIDRQHWKTNRKNALQEIKKKLIQE